MSPLLRGHPRPCGGQSRPWHRWELSPCQVHCGQWPSMAIHGHPSPPTRTGAPAAPLPPLRATERGAETGPRRETGAGRGEEGEGQEPGDGGTAGTSGTVGDKAGAEPGADPGSCHTGHGQRGSDARLGVKSGGSGTRWPLGSPRGRWGQDCPREPSWGGHSSRLGGLSVPCSRCRSPGRELGPPGSAALPRPGGTGRPRERDAT